MSQAHLGSFNGTVTPGINMLEVFKQNELVDNPNSILNYGNMVLKSLQGCELLKVANADTGRTVNIQINSPLVGSYIESTLGISGGKAANRPFLKATVAIIQSLL